MEADRKALRKKLKEAGLSEPLIDAAWPTWWSDEAFSSMSARAELRFTIARKLGLNPKSLFHDEVEFVWRDDARYKHLSNETDEEKAALTSYGISLCRILVKALKGEPVEGSFGAMELRKSILQSRPFIDLQSLLGTCWAIGLPVIHIRVFPLEAKRMAAMAVRSSGRHAILLGRDAQYPAPVAFILAHEIAHVMLGHISTSSAIIDIGDPLSPSQGDIEEAEADRYALELLLGTSSPDIQTNVEAFNGRQLAQAVLDYGLTHGMEPGNLALCLAHARSLWPVAYAAMQHIYTVQKPVWPEVNGVAEHELDFAAMSDDQAEYLRNIMGIANG